jgi:hypothetical protein
MSGACVPAASGLYVTSSRIADSADVCCMYHVGTALEHGHMVELACGVDTRTAFTQWWSLPSSSVSLPVLYMPMAEQLSWYLRGW